MLEDFKLLIESEKKAVKNILKPRIDDRILKRLLGGFFDETGKRLMAFAFMQVNKSKYHEYEYLFDLKNGGHSAMYFSEETAELTRKWLDATTFSYKSSEERISEGIYKSVLITYYAEYDFDEWNILREACFSDSRDQDKLLNSRIHYPETTLKDYFFKSSIFQETAEHHADLVSRINEIKGYYPYNLPAQERAFVGHSCLVYMVRAAKKREINGLFQDYIIKTVYEPLLIDLKTKSPENYRTVWGFYGHVCNFLIPSHRQFCLIMFIATDRRKESKLEFYFYSLQEDKLYNWTYFQYHPHNKNPEYDTILDIFSPISQLNDFEYLSNPECNFDDDDFWDNCVLIKSGEEHLYLTEVSFIRFR